MAKSAIVPSAQVRNFRQLKLWQEAMDLAVLVHQAAGRLPASERFELGREMRRSATSIPSNVAEGFSRHSRKAYRLHVAIAVGSTAEVETQLELALRLSHLATDLVEDLLERCATVARIGQGLWRSLRPSRPR
ncbi:MAG TPA: four helix bundle protein [Vicinamibacterales bacterium]|nr:four helix bundle protein [Vicinamibacterales bacterium]